MDRMNWRFWRYNGMGKSSDLKPCFRLVGLATCQYRQKFFYQGEKGGDFLSGFLKKYYPYLDEKKPFGLWDFAMPWHGSAKPKGFLIRLRRIAPQGTPLR
ncbi:hypothetical protein ACIQ69_27985 [Bacillus paramycoides]|uniref:hypothetical protein n=1 Tax=Bacillus paramycoides TaxID=2026194 RepID=UPI00381ABBA8